MLKQTSLGVRALFLQLFTQELILNSKPIEKPRAIAEITIPFEARKFEKPEEPRHISIGIPATKQTLTEELTSPLKPARQLAPIRPSILPKMKPRFAMPLMQVARPKTPVLGLPRIEEGVSLGKLNIFLADKAITMIECPGPGKFILIKRAGQVNVTKIILSQKEISEIIKNFAEKARIPLISGVFKASVGDLTITSIISEFIGSKFIIYKASPYSLIDSQTR